MHLLHRARAAEQHKESALRQKQRQQQQLEMEKKEMKGKDMGRDSKLQPEEDKDKDKDKESAVKFGKAFEFANTGFFRYSAHTLRNERAWVGRPDLLSFRHANPT